MNKKLIIPLLVAITLLIIAGGVGLAQERTPSDRINGPAGIEAALGTEFTYQGQLIDGSTPANGTYDLRFSLYDDPTAGIQVGSALPVDDDVVSDGLFTVQLDFGSGIFVGDALYLQVDVRPGASTGSYTSLAPRQPLTAAPYANFAQRSRWSGLIGMPSGFADGIDDDTTYSAGTGLYLNSGAFNIAAAYELPQGCNSGEVAKYQAGGGRWYCAVDNTGSGGSFWSLTGNLGTNPATDYVGTGDAVSLTLAVNATPALRLEPTAGTPNVIAGNPNNAVSSGLEGVAIGGGGTDVQPNLAGGSFATIAGGFNNSAIADYAAVSGGYGNAASGFGAIVGGGGVNVASGTLATVGGGEFNTASSDHATVGGGAGNVSSGTGTTIPGGISNTASGDFSFAAGRYAKANNEGCFVWGDATADYTDFVECNIDNAWVVRASGGIGFGTETPQNQLHVQGSINATATPPNHVAQIENNNTGNTADVLALKVGITGNPASGNNFVTFYNGSDTIVGQIEGNNSGGVSYSSGAADVAEYLPRLDPTEAIAPGDLVGLFDGRISRRTEGATQVMVISSQPIVVGNHPGEESLSLYESVAFLGQVTANVRGPVQAGDYIVPSGRNDGNGTAVSPEAITPAQLIQVVGQAWESSQDAGLKPVLVAVGLGNDNPLVSRMRALESANENLRQQVGALQIQAGVTEARLAALEKQGGGQLFAGGWLTWLVLMGTAVVGIGMVRTRRGLKLRPN